MLVGALAGVAGAYYLKSLVLAVLITIIVGALMGLVVSYLTVSRRTNQVVTGLMINMLCLGATDMLFSMMSETRTNRCETFPIIFPEFMQNIPVIGKILFCQPISTWIAFVLPIFAAYFMYKTRWGLNVRAVGDNPKAAATAGLDVIKIKYQTVILSGIFAALGGCALTLAEVGYFSAGGMGQWPRLHRYGGLRGRRLGSHPHFSGLPGLRRCRCGPDPYPNTVQLPLSVPADVPLCGHRHRPGHHGQALLCAQDLGCCV